MTKKYMKTLSLYLSYLSVRLLRYESNFACILLGLYFGLYLSLLFSNPPPFNIYSKTNRGKLFRDNFRLWTSIFISLISPIFLTNYISPYQHKTFFSILYLCIWLFSYTKVLDFYSLDCICIWITLLHKYIIIISKRNEIEKQTDRKQNFSALFYSLSPKNNHRRWAIGRLWQWK